MAVIVGISDTFLTDVQVSNFVLGNSFEPFPGGPVMASIETEELGIYNDPENVSRLTPQFLVQSGGE